MATVLPTSPREDTPALHASIVGRLSVSGDAEGEPHPAVAIPARAVAAKPVGHEAEGPCIFRRKCLHRPGVMAGGLSGASSPRCEECGCQGAPPQMGPRRRRVAWTNSAVRGLDSSSSFVAQESRDTALRLLERVLGAADSLEILAERGSVVPEFDDPDVRQLLVDPFRLL